MDKTQVINESSIEDPPFTVGRPPTWIIFVLVVKQKWFVFLNMFYSRNFEINETPIWPNGNHVPYPKIPSDEMQLISEGINFKTNFCSGLTGCKGLVNIELPTGYGIVFRYVMSQSCSGYIVKQNGDSVARFVFFRDSLSGYIIDAKLEYDTSMTISLDGLVLSDLYKIYNDKTERKEYQSLLGTMLYHKLHKKHSTESEESVSDLENLLFSSSSESELLNY